MRTENRLNIQFSLPVTILKEGKYFIAYTPVLDISTSGKTFEEAKKRFDELVCLFFEELIEKKTLDKVLTGLGWTRTQKTWFPPVIVSSVTQKFNIPLSCLN